MDTTGWSAGWLAVLGELRGPLAAPLAEQKLVACYWSQLTQYMYVHDVGKIILKLKLQHAGWLTYFIHTDDLIFY